MNEDLLQYANQNQPRTPEEKESIINNAAAAYEKYMDALGFDWRNDPNSSNTPKRVAKAFVNDLAEGCYTEPPKITAFDNIDKYDGIVFQGNITVHSFCSHHHLPFMQIHTHIDKVCDENNGVAVLVEANHMCACVRGVKHDSTMKTARMSGAFLDKTDLTRQEFYNFVRDLN